MVLNQVMQNGSYCGPTVLCRRHCTLKVQSYPLLISGHVHSSTSQKGPEQRCCLVQYIENSESIACGFCSCNGSSPLYWPSFLVVLFTFLRNHCKIGYMSRCLHSCWKVWNEMLCLCVPSFTICIPLHSPETVWGL